MSKYKSWLLVEIEHGLSDLPHEQRAEIVGEVEEHLDAAIQARLELGLTPEEADREAAIQFGEAEEFVKAMRLAHERPNPKARNRCLILAAICTACIPLWALTVQDYQWYYVSGLMSAVAPWMLALMAVFAASLGGVRIKARCFFLIALAGGCLLVPILAARFAGSGMFGGVVVRSLALRPTVERTRNFQIDMANKLWQSLSRFDQAAAQAKAGMLTLTYVGNELRPLGPVAKEDWEMTRYRGDSAMDGLMPYPNLEEAQQAWSAYGADTRAMLAKFANIHANDVGEFNGYLSESYFTRLWKNLSYAPTFAVLWGLILVALHSVGVGCRVLWDRIKSPPRRRGPLRT